MTKLRTMCLRMVLHCITEFSDDERLDTGQDKPKTVLEYLFSKILPYNADVEHLIKQVASQPSSSELLDLSM